MNKLLQLWQLFKVGYSVSDPALWKKRQITATALAAVILGIVNTLSAFGYSIPVDMETANAISAGIIAMVNTVLTITTTDKIGVKDTAPKEGDENNESAEKNDSFPDIHNFHKF
jgi:hypothetical protein